VPVKKDRNKLVSKLERAVDKGNAAALVSFLVLDTGADVKFHSGHFGAPLLKHGMEQARFGGSFMASLEPVRKSRPLLSRCSLCRFRSSIVRLMVATNSRSRSALGPSLFRSQHVGELG
jgi:hypothetical protein